MKQPNLFDPPSPACMICGKGDVDTVTADREAHLGKVFYHAKCSALELMLIENDVIANVRHQCGDFYADRIDLAGPEIRRAKRIEKAKS